MGPAETKARRALVSLYIAVDREVASHVERVVDAALKEVAAARADTVKTADVIDARNQEAFRLLHLAHRALRSYRSPQELMDEIRAFLAEHTPSENT